MTRARLQLRIVILLAGTVAALALGMAPAAMAGPTVCGGFAGLACPTGLTCIDDPGDACSPVCGGADCGGVCVQIVPPFCGGIAGLPCPPGSVCLDEKGDSCSPACGGADCGGSCYVQASPAPFCGGIAGIPCPGGLICVDDSGDVCDPDCGGADCGGVCVAPAKTFCGGIAGIPCAAGFTCVDDPSDTCDPTCGGADCSGMCVIQPICGDGVVGPGEDCDDGNMDSGDCCSASCQFETGPGSPPCCDQGVCQVGQTCGVVCFTGLGLCGQGGASGNECICF